MGKTSLVTVSDSTYIFNNILIDIIFKVKAKLLSHVRLFATPWTVAYQAHPIMVFSRQECWSGVPFPSAGDLNNPGIQPRSPALLADTLPPEPSGKPKLLPINLIAKYN